MRRVAAHREIAERLDEMGVARVPLILATQAIFEDFSERELV
jgi:hypothetical protein